MTQPKLPALALILGCICGFAGACWFGKAAARYSKPSSFHRFHPAISPDTIFYPPYNMLEQLALVRWKPGRIIVIIGGNSVLNGVSQPASDLWSSHLQDELGGDFVVVNLAFRGSFPTEGGAVVAESLLRRGYPVVFIANTAPAAGAGLPIGPTYGYVYWQARARGLLYDWPSRDQSIAALLSRSTWSQRDHMREARLGGQLDCVFNFQSLWHHIAYRHVFTVWNFVTREHAWRPRDAAPDNESSPRPVGERFQSYFEIEMENVRGFSRYLEIADQSNTWHMPDSVRQHLKQDIESGFPEPLHSRMLMILGQNAQYYRRRLTTSELQRDNLAYTQVAKIWNEHGIRCIIGGDGFLDEDYTDRTHLTATGGRKLSALVAREVRSIAHDNYESALP